MSIDANVLMFLQDTVRNPVLTPVFTMITVLGNGAILWILISLALLVSKKTRTIGLTCILALLVSLLINNIILKNLVGRIRPYDMIEGLLPLVKKPRDYSFPSGHTSSSFAAAWILYKKMPKRFGIPALVLAGLIGLSRLYLGVHYPTDVLFGVISGIGSGWIALMVMKRVIDK